MARSVVLMSGGLVSAAMAALAADEGEAVWLHVDYGQRNRQQESAAVKALAEHFAPTSVVRLGMSYWPTIGDYPLLATGTKDQFPDALAIREGPDVAYIPGLMTSMVCAALALALQVQADRVFVGLIENRGIGDVPTDSLYPDRSRESLAAWNWQYQIATSRAGKSVRLEAPFIASKQGDVALLAHRLSVPVEQTWSCYRTGPTPCRRCYGCAARAHGFLQLGNADPQLTTQMI